MSNNQSFALLLTQELGIKEIYTNTFEQLSFQENDTLLKYVTTSSLTSIFDLMKDTNRDIVCSSETIVFNGVNSTLFIQLIKTGNEFIIVGRNKLGSKDTLIQDLVEINNTLSSNYREVYQRDTETIFNDSIYDEISKINNQLLNTQRELNIKNFELEQLNLKFKRLGLVDHLTDLPNRRSFFDDAYQLLLKEKYDLIMMDLNNFKLINDTKGHDKGDEVLIIFANLLHKFTPDLAKLYRLGGDEFAILNPCKNIIDMERIIHVVEKELQKIHPDLGIAYGQITVDKENIVNDKKIEEAMHEADKLMYVNKEKKKSAQ